MADVVDKVQEIPIVIQNFLLNMVQRLVMILFSTNNSSVSAEAHIGEKKGTWCRADTLLTGETSVLASSSIVVNSF